MIHSIPETTVAMSCKELSMIKILARCETGDKPLPRSMMTKSMMLVFVKESCWAGRSFTEICFMLNLCKMWLKHINEEYPWRCHQIEAFFALLALCEGNPPVTVGFPAQSPVTRGFNVFFAMCLNKWLGKQSRRRWFETPSRPLWRHCDIMGKPGRYTRNRMNIWNWYIRMKMMVRSEIIPPMLKKINYNFAILNRVIYFAFFILIYID